MSRIIYAVDDAEAINRRLEEIRAARGEKPPAFEACAKCGTPFTCRNLKRCDMDRADEPATERQDFSIADMPFVEF